jgi:rhamnulokinase
VGCESKVPNTSPAALGINLTNELGVAGTVRNLKNVSGMWIISELMREWRDLGNEISIEELVLAAKNSVIEAYINPNSPTYIHPGQMQAKVQDECRQTGQPVPTTVGEIARCVYQSLAKSYASTIREISEVLSRNFKEVVVVGGGAANSFLNQLTADATRLPVRVGPVEATLLGNIGVQAIAAGVLESLPELRQIIARCYPGEIFTPTI